MAKESAQQPAAAQAVAAVVDQPKSDDFGRNLQQQLPKFAVSWPKDNPSETATVAARDEIEAWAIFCDTIKKWPSPKSGKVEKQ